MHDLTITFTRTGETHVMESTLSGDTYTVTFNGFPLGEWEPTEWRRTMLGIVERGREQGWSDDYVDCEFELSHTREFCFRPLCRVS